MTRASESAAYVGGISAMLAQADVCPSCGKPMTEHRVAFPFRGAKACPEVVLGTIPVVTDLSTGAEAAVDALTVNPMFFDPMNGGLPAVEWTSPKFAGRRQSGEMWRVPAIVPEDE
jgi:hypothetical protein